MSKQIGRGAENSPIGIQMAGFDRKTKVSARVGEQRA